MIDLKDFGIISILATKEEQQKGTFNSEEKVMLKNA